MSNTPKLRFKEFEGEWNKSLLKDKSDILSGKRIPKGMSLTNNKTDTPYITVSDMGDTTVDITNLKYIEPEVEKCISKYKVYENDIIISVAGTLGKINIIDSVLDGANLTENCDKITNLKGLNFKYLFYFLNTSSINNQIQLSSTVCSQPKLALEKIRLFKIDYPSLPEQEKIASLLSLFDEKIELQEKKVESLKKYKKGMMQKIFSQEIRFKDENGENYPEWEVKKLEDILKEYSNRNNSNLYKVMSVGKYGIRPRDEIYSKNLSEDISKNKLIYKNTLTIGMGSKQIDIGILHEEAFYSVSPAYTTFEIHNCNPLYLEAYFKKYNRYLSSLYMITGARQGKSINKVDFLKHKIELPSLPEQEKIASLLSTIDKKIELEEEKLEELKEYKKGLLQQMFI